MARVKAFLKAASSFLISCQIWLRRSALATLSTSCLIGMDSFEDGIRAVQDSLLFGELLGEPLFNLFYLFASLDSSLGNDLVGFVARLVLSGIGRVLCG